jgi:hypothetical protein
MRTLSLLSLAISLTLLSACASKAVSNDALVQRAGFALGLQAGSFSISDRRDDGVRTQFRVTTKSGAVHDCYVTGTFSVTGRIVSDAICNRPGEAPKNPLLNR